MSATCEFCNGLGTVRDPNAGRTTLCVCQRNVGSGNGESTIVDDAIEGVANMIGSLFTNASNKKNKS